jgi:hypothetical protein
VKLNLSTEIFNIEDNTKHKFEIINTSYIFGVIMFLKVKLSKKIQLLNGENCNNRIKLICQK